LLTNFIGFVKRVSENPSCHYGFSGTSFLNQANMIFCKQVFANPRMGEQFSTLCTAGLGKCSSGLD
jgi:hypothetical protein